MKYNVVTPKKIITIAAPWRYSRSHCLLHELAHLVYAKFMNSDLIKKWTKIAKSTKMKKEDRQDVEELFAHAYSNYYEKNPVVKFDFPEWQEFIKSLPS